jgi:hypothetical protein
MSVFQDALAGLAKTFTGDSKRNSHTAFIESQLLPAVQKVQKEIGWRKYKVRCVLRIASKRLCSLRNILRRSLREIMVSNFLWFPILLRNTCSISLFFP